MLRFSSEGTRRRTQTDRNDVLQINITINIIIFFFFSVTLYWAHNRISRGNLVLRHSVPNFPLNSGGIYCVLCGGIQHRALPRHQNEENGNIKYFIFSSGNRTHNLSVYSLCPCATTGFLYYFFVILSNTVVALPKVSDCRCDSEFMSVVP